MSTIVRGKAIPLEVLMNSTLFVLLRISSLEEWIDGKKQGKYLVMFMNVLTA